jgi:ATP-dependent exoDNAse (exonuclease V) alpha subunit
MLAYRRSDVDQLNGHARAQLKRAGRLFGSEIVVNDRPFQAGDQIVCLRNDRRLGIHNGTRATILRIHPDTKTMLIGTGTQFIDLPARYLDAGHIAHGYATTIHKAQGATVDPALILGSDELTRERGYVALSRGRHTNRIYITGELPDSIERTAGPPDLEREPAAMLRSALQRRTAKGLALDGGSPDGSIGAAPPESVEVPSVGLDVTDDFF